MPQKTLEAILHPDGRVTLPTGQLPDHPVRVMITLLEDGGATALSEWGDHLDQLTVDEERLARGEVRWQ
jgi:hypothetical protein